MERNQTRFGCTLLSEILSLIGDSFAEIFIHPHGFRRRIRLEFHFHHFPAKIVLHFHLVQHTQTGVAVHGPAVNALHFVVAGERVAANRGSFPEITGAAKLLAAKVYDLFEHRTQMLAFYIDPVVRIGWIFIQEIGGIQLCGFLQKMFRHCQTGSLQILYFFV